MAPYRRGNRRELQKRVQQAVIRAQGKRVDVSARELGDEASRACWPFRDIRVRLSTGCNLPGGGEKKVVLEAGDGRAAAEGTSAYRRTRTRSGSRIHRR
jgi:hypothetical protein